MRKRRRSRKNAWPGKPRLHSKAARKGWRRSRRRTRRNAGTMSMVKHTTRSLRAGFDPAILKRASAILLGNISTTWYVDQIASRVPMIRSNPIFDIGALLLLGGAQGVFVSKVLKQPKYATDIMIGGILAGVTRAAKTVLPKQFSTCGLGEDLDGLADDLDGLGDYTISPNDMIVNTNGMYEGTLNHQGRFPHGPMHGMDAYPSPDTRMIHMHGLSDHAVLHASHSGRPLITEQGHFIKNGMIPRHNPMAGLADMALAEEFAMQM